jgi:protein-disulfide isomerase
LAVIGTVLLAACSSSAQQAKAPGPNDTVATVGSLAITLAEVDQRALEQPAGPFGSMTLAQALYEARRSALDDLVGEKLIAIEAKARGVDASALTDQEINAKIAAVTDAEIATWYQANPGRVQGAPLDQVRAPIRQLLVQERTQAVYTALVDRLKAKTAVRITLDVPRRVVAAANGPARGPANAPVEIIEFSDFQCPYCLRAHPIVQEVLSTYGNRIRFVYRHFPLPNHPNARPAAEASQCAAEQGKFWEYHDRLFANQGRLSDDDLKKTAADLGLDSGRFASCFASHKYKAQVDADLRAGTEAGVSGTPSFFINGRMLTGAQPFDAFKRAIDEELERKK